MLTQDLFSQLFKLSEYIFHKKWKPQKKNLPYPNQSVIRDGYRARCEKKERKKKANPSRNGRLIKF